MDGSKRLNKKLIEVISNYLPDLIVLGHADLINFQTLVFIKKNYPEIKVCQWFLDRMDSDWSKNLVRFKDKIKLMDQIVDLKENLKDTYEEMEGGE